VGSYLTEAREQGLRIQYTLDSHGHNDYLSGLTEVVARTGSQVLGSAEAQLGYDHRPIHDGEQLELGEVGIEVLQLRAIRRNTSGYERRTNPILAEVDAKDHFVEECLRLDNLPAVPPYWSRCRWNRRLLPMPRPVAEAHRPTLSRRSDLKKNAR
jgi:hypothetical protein